MIVLDPDTGRPLAFLEGSTLTAIRTAAASGAATDLQANPASATLAILGAGRTAQTRSLGGSLVTTHRSRGPAERFSFKYRVNSP